MLATKGQCYKSPKVLPIILPEEEKGFPKTVANRTTAQNPKNVLQTQHQAQEHEQKERGTSGEGYPSLLTWLLRPVLDHMSWVAPKDTATQTSSRSPVPTQALCSLSITGRVAKAKRS